jgi:hypothetical protein
MNLHSAVHIPLTIEEDKLIEGSIMVLSIIRPTWAKENITFKVSFCCILDLQILRCCVEGGDTKRHYPSFLYGVTAPQMALWDRDNLTSFLRPSALIIRCVSDWIVLMCGNRYQLISLMSENRTCFHSSECAGNLFYKYEIN